MLGTIEKLQPDLKELGESLDAGQAGLVVVGVSDMESKIEAAMQKAEKVAAKELEAILKDGDKATLEAKTETLAINWNPITETWRNLKLAHENIVVFRSLLGISWMWFFGAVFLSQFPAFAKEVLHGNEQVASLLLVVFSVGIGIGSLLCEVLSKRHVEIGLVPLGAIGMTVFIAGEGLPGGPEALMEALEKSYPGFRAGDDGMILANPQAHQTMQGWMRPWGTGER